MTITRQRVLLVAVPLALVVAAGWYAWREYTTPAVPDIPLDGVFKERAEKVRQAQDQARQAPRSGKAWGELGMTLLSNGFNEEAVPCFAHAQRFDPEEPRWPYFQGSLLLSRGKRDGYEKLREALAATRTRGERAAVLFQLSQALTADGQFDEAEQRANELRAIEGSAPSVDFVFGLLALGRGDRAAARDYLARLTSHPSARKRACSLLVGLVEGDEKLAREYRRQAGELPEDQPWPDSFESALGRYRANPPERLGLYRELQAQGRHAEAILVLRELVATSPDEPSCFTLGFNLFRTNQFEEAAQRFRQASGFNPRNAKTYLFLGVSLLEMGEMRAREPGGKEAAADLFRQAVEAEDQALRIQNDIADAHRVRGLALKRLGRTEEAIASLRQAAVVGAEYAEMHQVLGEALAEAGRVKEGLEHLENAVRLAKPNDPRPRAALDKWKGKQ